MPRLRYLLSGLMIGALVVAGTACSKDEKKATSNDRGSVSFADPPEGSTDLGLCYAYDIAQMKQLLGGDETFRRLAPEAIGEKGDAVTGEVCAWERKEDNGDAVSLRIEARNFGEDTATLASQFERLQEGTLASEPVANVGDAAFTSRSETTSLLQIRSGPYLISLSSLADGGLEPVSKDALVLMGTAGVEQLS